MSDLKQFHSELQDLPNASTEVHLLVTWRSLIFRAYILSSDLTQTEFYVQSSWSSTTAP